MGNRRIFLFVAEPAHGIFASCDCTHRTSTRRRGLGFPGRGDFFADGFLSRAKNFEFRPQQQEMAVAVARALQNREHLAVEAGTGVGKALAYLIPAILFAVAQKKKAVISTHTINLQEQLTEKDLPMLAGVLGALPVPVKFSFTMLKGRANYLCTRRLAKGHAAERAICSPRPRPRNCSAFTNGPRKPRTAACRILTIEPDPKVWAQVCSERGLCSPKICGHPVRFCQGPRRLLFPARAQPHSCPSDVLVLNHTLFFTLLGGVDEEVEGGILFKNDFVIFDEAHTMESVASRHIGLSVSSGQVRYALNRLWNPRTEKGLLATLRQGAAVKLVADILSEADKFFENVEAACEEIQKSAGKNRFGGGEPANAAAHGRNCASAAPNWCKDNVTLPIQRLREAVSELIKTERGQGHRPGTGRVQPAAGRIARGGRDVSRARARTTMFIGWNAAARRSKNLSLNAAPVDVAEFLRRRLFESDTSVIMTSATLATKSAGIQPATGESATPAKPTRRCQSSA